MPYVWGIGLIYFGMNDEVPFLVLWCIGFVVLFWMQELISRHIKLIMSLYETFEYVITQKQLSDEAVERLAVLDLMMLGNVDHSYRK